MRFELVKTLDIIAPALVEQPWSEAEVMGSAVWLLMHSLPHHDMPLHALSAVLLPAIKHRQFILASEGGQPVFYLSWANLSEEAESRYLSRHVMHMQATDWDSGDRMWVLDWIAPFGHTKTMCRLIEHQLFANRMMRSLYHRGDERGLKIKTFCGKAVLPEESHAWFNSHPVTVNKKSH